MTRHRDAQRAKRLSTSILAPVTMFAPLVSVAQTASVPRHINIFAPSSTPAIQINHLSMLVFAITGAIFLFVAALLLFVIFRYRARGDESVEPPQVYGSNRIELAWTVIPVLIVIVLFLATARIIFAVQDPEEPRSALDVTVIGHQFWWEFRYPNLGIVTANELHVPVSSANDPSPTYLKLMSADVVHSFWVPQLAGKTDLIPNRVNQMWLDPLQTGVYLGQCAQFCGMQHANMLIRVYVDTPKQFEAWVRNQQSPARTEPQVALGRHIFETQSCMNCHTIRGTAATGRFGPDLTHLMSRSTIASGIAPNNRATLVDWIKSPDHLKKGALMPAMQLSDDQVEALVDYLSTLQ